MVLRKCHKCHADMKKEKTETTIGWGDYEIVLRGIEAHVCPECGEKVFDYETTLMLQNLGEALSQSRQIDQGEILDVEEVAELLRVTKQTVYNMIKDGRLKAFKAGREWRFHRKDIENIINNEDDDIIAAARGEDISEKDVKAIKEVLNNSSK